MSPDRVLTFEAECGRIHPAGRHASLAEASASLPEGAYTTLRTYGGRRLLRLDLHLRRLEESVALQGRAGTIDGALAKSALAAALERAAHPESRLRLTFAPPRLFVSVEAFTGPAAQLYEEGVACATLRVRRENPHAKDTRFIAVAQQAYGRLPPGVEEGLIVCEDGAILEGLSSNFFAVKDGTLRTEGERALAGVTRSLVLEVAAALVPVEPRAILLGELPRAAEAFITSVSRGVLPVVRIDGRPVGDGRVGQRTRAIQEGFAALVEREAEQP
jgi:branched-subunit amino acid aminotransferase/4-amino-4-deoxychorismate lyase